MDDAQPVRLGNAPGYLLDQPRGTLRRPGNAIELSVQAAAGDILELQERQAIGLADVVDLHDVRVLEPGDRLGLRQEPGTNLGVGMGTGEDHLQGARAIEPDLAGPVDDPHAAPAQQPLDLETGQASRQRLQGRTGGQGLGWPALALRLMLGSARVGAQVDVRRERLLHLA